MSSTTEHRNQIKTESHSQQEVFWLRIKRVELKPTHTKHSTSQNGITRVTME